MHSGVTGVAIQGCIDRLWKKKEAVHLWSDNNGRVNAVSGMMISVTVEVNLQLEKGLDRGLEEMAIGPIVISKGKEFTTGVWLKTELRCIRCLIESKRERG